MNKKTYKTLEFNKIINNSETASSTWYKDLPYKFTVTCLDKVLNFVNNFSFLKNKVQKPLILPKYASFGRCKKAE